MAAVASAYMLSWLHLALGMGIEVVGYCDEAYGVFSEISAGVHWISEVILCPKIVYDESSRASAAAEARLHELAHEQCFIAQSIKSKVTVRGTR